MSSNYIFTKLALEKLTEFEGNSLTAYWDNIGRVWTIGRGHTGSLDALFGNKNTYIYAGLKITEEQSLILCKSDLEHVMDMVEDFAQPSSNRKKLTNNQFSALCIWAYNIGANAAENSSLADYINESLGNYNMPDPSVIHSKLMAWNKSKGKIIPGLTNRREKEFLLYMTPDDPEDKEGAFPS